MSSKRVLVGLAWLAALGALLWALRRVDLQALWLELRLLAPWQILALVVLNGVIVFAMSGRWWMLLAGMGYKLPYVRLVGYRLASYSVSYLTPGPQFGGEPLQVLLPQLRHGVPGNPATVALFLDKTLDMMVNFAVLTAGAALMVSAPYLNAPGGKGWLVLAGALLCLPVGYLLLIRRRQLPLSTMARLLPAKYGLAGRVQRVEQQLAVQLHEHPRVLVKGLLLSVATWMLMIGEYGLMVSFLHIPLDVRQTVIALTAARFAFLTPLPGGLGALEASQVFAMSMLQADPAAGLALALLIRGRDMLLAGVGMLVGGREVLGKGSVVNSRRYDTMDSQ